MVDEREVVPSYAEFARIFRSREDINGDPSFAVRVLRQSVLHAQELPSGPELDHFHRPAPETGSSGWDALLAGVAVFTGSGRVSAGVLDWCKEPGRSSEELFDPLGIPQKYLLVESLRTPAAIRERNVILSIGNLQGL
jgi:hypothetical protein